VTDVFEAPVRIADDASAEGFLNGSLVVLPPLLHDEYVAARGLEFLCEG
jgi:hypothetical protein